MYQGVDASPGTLERALIRDSISQIRLFCQEMNVPTRPCGSIVCHWPWDAEDRLEEILLESHDAGDTHATRMDTAKVQRMEANLSASCLGGVHIPGEIVLDPWRYSIALAVHSRENGAIIFTNFELDPNKTHWDNELWTIKRTSSDIDDKSIPSTVRSRAVVSATGLWSDLIQQKIHSNSKWKARPRRGQYRIFSSNGNTRIHHPIQPIPTQRTKGIFIFSTLYDQIIVGPTALDQESRTDRSVDPIVSDELGEHARRIIPELCTKEHYVGDYVGIRPGTDKRDYQIDVNFFKRWITVAGIRSTGLTASLGIGRHAVHLLRNLLPESDPPVSIQTTPLPPLGKLVNAYHNRADETVELGGRSYRVTHPITKLGWNAQTGLASPLRE